MLYLLFLSVWPLLTYIATNLAKINSYSEICIISFSSLFISFLIGKSIQKFSKHNLEAWLPCFLVITVLMFSYGPMVGWIGTFWTGYFKASYIWVLILGIVTFSIWKISRLTIVQLLTKILIVTIFSSAIVEIIYSSIQRNNESVEIGKEDDLHFVLKHKPNIYYILVDAYARQDTLKEITAFDNKPFLDALEAKGFMVSQNMYSNYHFTGASLSATMNMQYHKQNKNDLIEYDQMHKSLKGSNNVRRILKDNQYKIINIPAHWHQISCYGYEDICIKGKSVEVYETFLSQTPLRMLKHKYLRNHYVDMEDIEKAVDLFPGEPKLVFAHLAHIHDALYDESGNPTADGHPAFSNSKDAQNYVNSIKVINQKLLTLMDRILQKDKNAIIIIQADHGPTFVGNQEPKDPEYWIKHSEAFRLKTKEDFRYTFGIFSAIYLPHFTKQDEVLKKYFLDKPSLVNVFRYIFAYLSEGDIKALEDYSSFLYFDKHDNAYKIDNVESLKS